MTIKVVVIDAGNLPDGIEFPPLQTAKYGWEQYPCLQENEISDRCWRADIMVALGTSVDRTMLAGLHRLKLVIVAGNACAALDQCAAREKGIEILSFPDAGFENPAEAQDLCGRISAAIDHYLRHSGE